MNKKEMILNDLQNKLDYLKQNTNYQIIGIFVYGSNNYNLDVYTEQYKSDIDTKCYIIPSFEDIITGVKPVSKTIEMPDKSHIDIKDVRLLPALWGKANPASLEALCTDYYILVDHRFQSVLDMKDSIVKMNKERLLISLLGGVNSKYKSLFKKTQRNAVLIDKYGYEPKQMHHIMRFAVLMERLIETDFDLQKSMILEGETRDIILNWKINPEPYKGTILQSYLEKQAIEYIESMEKMKDNYISIYQPQFDKDTFYQLKEMIIGLIRENCIQEIILKNKEGEE